MPRLRLSASVCFPGMGSALSLRQRRNNGLELILLGVRRDIPGASVHGCDDPVVSVSTLIPFPTDGPTECARLAASGKVSANS